MPSRQSGRIVELNILCAVVALAGVALASRHPGYFALTLVALALPFIPMTKELLDAYRRSHAATRKWRSLLAAGFEPAAQVRARPREGGAIIAVDVVAGRIAFVCGERADAFDIAEVKRLSVTRSVAYRWGDIGRTRHGFRFVVGSDAREFGLSFSRRAEAARAFATLRGVLEGRVPIDEAEPR